MNDQTRPVQEQAPAPPAGQMAGRGGALDPTLFTAPEMRRLQRLRERVAQGQMGELAQDYKRLRFARWLVQQGKLQG